ncbi:NUDIX hydrolase [Streptomyces sp. RFCAC02]|uniref:NUDIX hydrolase n=1 Tax=Streptomyces sp. RFCAC02 TaxID=2499143 RepID=UPI0019D1CE43|nr:NUDIX hydrolase [Streptomyces sp. RFCAC02]
MPPATEARPAGSGEPIRAAGCVLWRPAAGRTGVELAVIHRPRYDDWSHPKGKLDPGESPEDAAVREVREETGMACALGVPLPTVTYLVDGRPKEVRYWVAEAVRGRFAPNDEVDVLLWLRPPDARARLSAASDRELLDEAVVTLRRAGRQPPTRP